MDTTIIFTLALSAFFLGGVIWLAIHSRRQQRAATRTHLPAPLRGEQARGDSPEV